MKILHIINNLGGGGAEKLVQEIIPLLQDKGNRVELLLLTDKNNKFKIDDVKIHNINKGIYSWKNIFEIRKYLKKDYDIIHSHLFPTQYWVSLASLFLKSKHKLIFTEHNTHNKRREYNILKIIEKYIYIKYDKVIAITEEVDDNLIEWVGKKNVNSLVIENGVNVSIFNNSKHYNKLDISSDINKEDVLLMMAGRFFEQKDHKTLIKSMLLLPHNYKLLLVGEGKLKKEIEDLVISLGLKNRVIFLGFRKDIPSLMKSVDINILSSNWEGFGLVAVEGMSSGKPFIGSNVEGLNNVIKGAGVLFEKGNKKDLSDKILELIRDKNYYNEVSNKCLERAKKYDINIMVDKYINLYEKLLDE